MRFTSPTVHRWFTTSSLLITLLLHQAAPQTHVKSPHRTLINHSSFSQITLNPIDEYLSLGNEEPTYQSAQELLLYSLEIESFATFDLDHPWYDYVDDYLSAATLRLYFLNGDLNETDFDILLNDDSEWALDLDDSECVDSHACWLEVNVTDGLLWSIEQRPQERDFTVRISVDRTPHRGEFASSIYEGGLYAPELILDFDRHQNLAQVQVDLMKMRSGSFNRKKKDENNVSKGMQLNSNQGPLKKPGRKPNVNSKPTWNKQPIASSMMQLNSNQRPNSKPIASIGLGKKKPGKRPGKRPGGNKKPNKKPGKRPNANKKPKPNANKKPNKKPNANKKPNKKPNANKKPKPNKLPSNPSSSKFTPSTYSSGSSSNNKPTFSSSSSSSSAKSVLKALTSKSNSINTKLFLYESPGGGWVPSSIYQADGLVKGLEVMNGKGVNGMYFYLGDDGGDVKKEIEYGLVNVAAFLAQSMKETIKYDACDENSWDIVDGKYPLSNSCGQLHQSYQDYHCPDHEKHMECEVDPNMEITAVTHAKWYGAPAPLFCRPKQHKNDFTGYWNHGFFCNVPWVDPPITCDVYEGQKAGRFENDEPYANSGGRTDVEGCCWWGRGVIQTTGICNFGKLNYYLGARAAKEGRDAPYAQYDFCKDPEIICSSEENSELKWIAGMFYWMESVQKYDSGGWNYMDELKTFVDGGFSDGNKFINAVSGIVNRGCHNPPCGTGAVDGGPERAKNFLKALGTFGLIKIEDDDKNDGKGGGVSVGDVSAAKTICGTDYHDASKCGKGAVECASSLDCPEGKHCWAGVMC